MTIKTTTLAKYSLNILFLSLLALLNTGCSDSENAVTSISQEPQAKEVAVDDRPNILLVVVDDLSTGWEPSRWLEDNTSRVHKDIEFLSS